MFIGQMHGVEGLPFWMSLKYVWYNEVQITPAERHQKLGGILKFRRKFQTITIA